MSKVDGQQMFEVIEEYDPQMKVIISSVYPVDMQMQLLPRASDYYDKSQGLAVLLEKINKVLYDGETRY